MLKFLQKKIVYSLIQTTAPQRCPSLDRELTTTYDSGHSFVCQAFIFFALHKTNLAFLLEYGIL
jgi:hypothetical protein